MEILAIALYILLAVAVVFFSLKLSNYVDLLDKKTNISGAFLGGILLAAVTSLPEFFTSLTSVVFLPVADNKLVLGNILGSNAFNLILFIFVFAIFFKKMVNAKVNKAHLITMAFTGGLYVITTIASFVFDKFNLLWGWFNPLSIVIAIIYVASIWLTPKEEESDEEDDDKSNLTVKKIIVLFILFSILLIAASVGLTYVVDWLGQLLGLDPTGAGALFLGIVTSLPEMTATINLCRKKNFNAAYGNILGSGVFNFFILAFADALSFRCNTTIFSMEQSAFILMCGAVISLIVAAVATIIKLKANVTSSIGWRILFTTFGVIIVSTYLFYVIVFIFKINLNIPFAPYIVQQ